MLTDDPLTRPRGCVEGVETGNSWTTESQSRVCLAPLAGQGCMSVRHRTPSGRTPGVIAVLAFAVVLALPGAAQANPLLSGYGGPGQGSQTLIGSSLVNSPGGGSSSGTSGSASGSELTVPTSRQSKTGAPKGPPNRPTAPRRRAPGNRRRALRHQPPERLPRPALRESRRVPLRAPSDSPAETCFS